MQVCEVASLYKHLFAARGLGWAYSGIVVNITPTDRDGAKRYPWSGKARVFDKVRSLSGAEWRGMASLGEEGRREEWTGRARKGYLKRTR
jgi:hypothetical protein